RIPRLEPAVRANAREIQARVRDRQEWQRDRACAPDHRSSSQTCSRLTPAIDSCTGSEVMKENIPVVDFRDFQTPKDDPRYQTFVEVLGKGLEKFGFVAVSHSGVDPELIEQCYRVAAETFALD